MKNVKIAIEILVINAFINKKKTRHVPLMMMEDINSKRRNNTAYVCVCVCVYVKTEDKNTKIKNIDYSADCPILLRS